MPKITPFLWFDDAAEDAAKYYCSVFKNSKINSVTRYAKGMPKPEGSVMTVEFSIDGVPFTALNGGPEFKFNAAVSFVVHCANQAEIDLYWDRLVGDGGKSQRCGWLSDKFGVTWQIVPSEIGAIFSNPDKTKVERAVAAMMKMDKLDIDTLKNA